MHHTKHLYVEKYLDWASGMKFSATVTVLVDSVIKTEVKSLNGQSCKDCFRSFLHHIWDLRLHKIACGNSVFNIIIFFFHTQRQLPYMALNNELIVSISSWLLVVNSTQNHREEQSLPCSAEVSAPSSARVAAVKWWPI